MKGGVFSWDVYIYIHIYICLKSCKFAAKPPMPNKAGDEAGGEPSYMPCHIAIDPSSFEIVTVIANLSDALSYFCGLDIRHHHHLDKDMGGNRLIKVDMNFYLKF